MPAADVAALKLRAYRKTAPNQETPSEQGTKRREKFEHNRTYSPHAAYTVSGWGSGEQDSWLKKKHWTETGLGLAGIEIVARMTLGAMFYALMSQSRTMDRVSSKYDPATYERKTASPLEHVAKFIDSTLGAGLTKGLGVVYGSKDRAEELLRFREFRFAKGNNGRPAAGRSLGAEMTAVTADFAAMSAGSAIGREALLTAFNPTVRASWLKDGKFDPTHFVKHLGSKLWGILTYNAGEDMAVALPYVFLLRGSRNFIDKYISPGFRNGSDFLDNGGSLVVDNKGFVMSEHQAAGMIDMQLRFTSYNVMTQIYRDWYNNTAEKLNVWQRNNFAVGTPEFIKNPASIPSRVSKRVIGGLRYMAISTIRSLIQMTPTVPFFSVIRMPASKPNGLIVHPELGMAVFKRDGLPLRRGGSKDRNPDVAARYAADHKEDIVWSNTRGTENERLLWKNPVKHPSAENRYEIFGNSKEHRNLAYSSLSRITDSIGRNVHKVSNHGFFSNLYGWFWDLTGKGDQKAHYSKQAALAGMPYASYFAAKVYFREKYVNEQMNLAIGRMVDGLVGFNLKETREGMSEIQRTIMGLPFKDPERQAKLVANHLRHPGDNSPLPENWTPELHKQYIELAKEGKEPSPAELTAMISQHRSDSYQQMADLELLRAGKPRSHGLKEGEKLKPDLLKQKGVNWTESPLSKTEEQPLASV